MQKVVNLSVFRMVTAEAMRVYELSQQLEGLETEKRAIVTAAEGLLHQTMQAYLLEEVEWTDVPFSRPAREAFIQEYIQVQKAFSDLKNTLYKLAETEVNQHPENVLKIVDVFLALDPDFPGLEDVWKRATKKIVDNCLTYSTTPIANNNVGKTYESIRDPQFGRLIQKQLASLLFLFPWVSNAENYALIMKQVQLLIEGNDADIISFNIHHVNFRIFDIPNAISMEWQKKIGKSQPAPTGQDNR